jgi:Ala-tRNA(Pro) deacylase
MMQLELGAPRNTEERQEKELRVYEFLDTLGVEYRRVDHAPAMTMDDCREIETVLGCLMCKNLFLANRQKTSFYLLLMPGDKRFSSKDLSAQLDVARLSFGEPEVMDALLDITPGSASILGLMNDKERQVQLLIDEDVLQGEYIGCHPCVNTSSLRLRVQDLTERIIPALGHPPRLVRL